MAKPTPENTLDSIVRIVAANPPGIGISDIEHRLESKTPRRTLQSWLKRLVDKNRLITEGERRWVIYRLPQEREDAKTRIHSGIEARQDKSGFQLSGRGAEIRDYVRQPIGIRVPVGYDRTFLESYVPNVTSYLSESEKSHLHQIGRSESGDQPAGTYATQILSRLLIDLSWNSSRLEGNTYSLLDTRRLIALGQAADDKEQLDAQMILNHKDAIEFLVGSVDEIGFARHTILNLHALLANNLLADPDSTGRLRHIAVGIEKSVFHPLEIPQIIEECFDQVLATINAISDPFEQSFFAMVHLPYLQPFDDVNKRVSRLAANIPFIKGNFTPLSFTDVARDDYVEAILGVYELNRVDLLKDIFTWAYERSTARYAAVRQSLGEPDPFRLKYREQLREIVGTVVREGLTKKSAVGRLTMWVEKNIKLSDQETFTQVAETELLSLHEGNFVRYRIRPSEFRTWHKNWDNNA